MRNPLKAKAGDAQPIPCLRLIAYVLQRLKKPFVQHLIRLVLITLLAGAIGWTLWRANPGISFPSQALLLAGKIGCWVGSVGRAVLW